MISRETIDRIFAAVQVEDIVGDFVALRKRGVNMLGLCPFHDEKTPSFTVSPTKNIYKCFGCGRGGNSVDFMMEHEGMSYPEALRHIAKKYNIEIEEKELTVEEQKKQTKRESLFIINSFAKDFYAEQLFESNMGKSIGLSYLKERGILLQTAKDFQLGYAPSNSPSLREEAEKNNFKTSYLEDLGLLNSKGRDFFYNRLMFSIHNLSGKVIAFAGRQFGNSKNSPKYINSPETEIYHKSNVLYGLHLSKKYIRQEDECLITEGYMDVISMYQAGIKNVVAASGTSLTKEQAKLIKRFSHNACLLFDGDAAGIKAALRGVKILLAEDLNLKIVLLPEGEDPDSFVSAHGQQAFFDYKAENEKDFILFVTEFYTADTENDPIAKSTAIKEIISNISLINDSVKRNIYIKECASRVGLAEAVLIEEVNKSINENIKQKRLDQLREIRTDKKTQDEVIDRRLKKNHPSQSEEGAKSEFVRDSFQEKDILRILLQFGSRQFEDDKEYTITEFIISNIKDTLSLWQDTESKALLEFIVNEFDQGQIHNEQFYLQHTDNEIQQKSIEILMSPFEYSPNWKEKWDMPLQNQKPPELNHQKDTYQALLRFNLKKINNFLNTFKEEFAKASDNIDELKIQKEMYYRMLEKRNELAQELNSVLL